MTYSLYKKRFTFYNMTNIIAFDSKVKKGSETVGCVGKESDGGAELRYRLYNPAVWWHSDL